MTTKHECPYCGTTEGLRIASQDPWGGSREYICEDCFTGQDDGPCFDDLPALDISEIAKLWNAGGVGRRLALELAALSAAHRRKE